MDTVQQRYQFDVKMHCGGCAGAVERILNKTEGVESYKVDLGTQTVEVTGAIPYDDILEKLKKSGKEVRSGKILEEPEALEKLETLEKPETSEKPETLEKSEILEESE